MSSDLFKPLCNKLKPVDLIACIVIVGGLALKFTGADGVVGTMLTAIAFYYFGKQGFRTNNKNV
jgi:hypothetical protein